MSKVKEAYYEGRENMSSGNRTQTKPRQGRRRGKKQVEGQMSFDSDEALNLWVKDPDKERAERLAAEKAAREEARHKAKLDYYDAFLLMLKRYAKFNMAYCPLECVENDAITDEVRSVINNVYDGDIEQLKIAVHHHRQNLSKACKRFRKAAFELDLFDVTDHYDAAYRNKDRRDRFRAIIKREVKKLQAGEDVEVYSPEDLEAEYQTYRVESAKRKHRKAVKDAEKTLQALKAAETAYLAGQN